MAATYSVGKGSRQSYRLLLNIDSDNGLGHLILALSNAVIRAEVNYVTAILTFQSYLSSYMHMMLSPRKNGSKFARLKELYTL